MTRRKRFDALEHGDLFWLDLDKSVVARAYGVTALTAPDWVQVHYVLPGDPVPYRRTVLAAHQVFILSKPPKGEIKELKALNGLHGTALPDDTALVFGQ
ncbi:hypothetical protein DOMOVOI_00830 [Brevundimonas phage vB_BpoS-Domovoi]|uniref:Uncharacterized protein n=1 Tax=Brevundimonas phage vB_BpoS-Domovoi TaxID=2948598 RepID=A0A9E7SJL3_9CAUD|nr:hypothetical protein DOMOVOI_00830 [Brevundimonas phage vB_BpoS-Domovoi]